ncbi:hypothetical protein DB35_06815 [Streptomyces abyssalis]|uniref:Small integral membrane protein n=1 Tax=Streptomyces abyssalis TaxID=933944 RepID=A0A1E7JTP1_9ACTN|nr:hypothetical protein AN215_05950 [Streptomyces abyssalis]OEU94282.1 hypothetical protein DB35_06815 [Streptomyces abyssalis]OEV27413.1 hypothetical protein AN219_22905 [Streptomyces nanshensis]
MDDVSRRLWNTAIDESDYTEHSEKYQTAIMDQYKLYVEMTDRMSVRRATANTFFLLVNSTVFAFIGPLTQNAPVQQDSVLVLTFGMLLVQCGAWFWLLRSYRQLNSAKFRVIGALEERLPAAPWFRAEWAAIGGGKDKSKYWPVTQLEQWVPVVFALAYVTLLVIVTVN